jgi:hypothetical protein
MIRVGQIHVGELIFLSYTIDPDPGRCGEVNLTNAGIDFKYQLPSW